MSYRLCNLVLGLLSVLLLTACIAQPRYHDRYDDRYDDRYSARSCETCGSIERIDPVWVRQRADGGGAVLGAIIGGLVGHQIGSGHGRDAATVAGAVAGGVIGQQVDSERRGERRGYRIEIRLDNGRWAVVTQLDDRGLQVGDRVMIRQQQVVRRD